MKSLLMGVVLAFSVSLGLGAPDSSAKASEGKAPAAEKAAKDGDSAKARPVIKLGMTGEEVAKVIGKPDGIEAVDTPAGKGEQWTYRRVAQQWTQQNAATVQMTPAFVGLGMPNDGIGEVEVPINHVENVTIYQVSSLLFIEGKLAAAKQWQEKESKIEG